MLKKLFIHIFLFSTLLNTFAQDKKPWEHSSSLGFTLTSGNSETMTLTGAHKSKWTGEKSSFAINLVGSYGVKETVDNSGNEDSEEFVKNFTGSLQYDRKISEKFYWFIGHSTEIDRIADLEYRLNFGPGLGYKLFNTDTWKVDFELGGNYILEKYENVDSDDKIAARVANKNEWKISSTANLWTKEEFLMNVEDSDDWRFNGEIGIDLKIKSYWNIRSSLTYKYNNDAPVGVKKGDFTFVTALVFKY